MHKRLIGMIALSLLACGGAGEGSDGADSSASGAASAAPVRYFVMTGVQPVVFTEYSGTGPIAPANAMAGYPQGIGSILIASKTPIASATFALTSDILDY